MQRKLCEAEFARLMASLHVWCHKWRDVQYCPNCRSPIFMTKHTDDRDSRENPESIVDYLILIGTTASWVECKQGTDSLVFAGDDGISDRQRRFLDSWTSRGMPCWLFVTVGPGRAPGGRISYLVGWESWKLIEKPMLDSNMKSVPFEVNNLKRSEWFNVKRLLKDYELAWYQGEWRLPMMHPFSLMYPEVLSLPPLFQ